MDEKEIIKQLIFILDCYEGQRPLLSNQGQALDGYSALAAFVSLAEKAKKKLLEGNA